MAHKWGTAPIDQCERADRIAMELVAEYGTVGDCLFCLGEVLRKLGLVSRMAVLEGEAVEAGGTGGEWGDGEMDGWMREQSLKGTGWLKMMDFRGEKGPEILGQVGSILLQLGALSRHVAK